MALWNFTLDNMSPYFSYSPSGDGSALTTAWRPWYHDSLYNTIPDEVGRGDSYHLTSLRGANVTFQFFGTGISLFGASNTTYGVTIDKVFQGLVESPTDKSLILFSKYGLLEGLHSVTLSAQTPPSNSSLLGFASASVSSTLRKDENPPSPFFYDSSNTASLEYSGQWTTENMKGVPNTTVSAPFQQTTSQGAAVALTFTGGVAVAVKGMTGSVNGQYSVSLDGDVTTYNGSSIWTVPDALLFFRSGLDPNSTHRISIFNLNNDFRLCLNSITVYQYESKNRPPAGPPKKFPSPSRPSTNIGIIIGPIIGALILCLIGGLFWYCRRRVTKQQPSKYTPRAYTGPRGADGTILTRTPAFSMNTTIPVDESSILSDTSFYSPGTGDSAHSSQGYMYQVPMNDPASQKRLTRLSLGGDRQSSSPAVQVYNHTNYAHATQTNHAFRESISGSSLGQTASSSTSSTRSPHRKPLPTIPVPSYDAALRGQTRSPRDVKSMMSLMSSPRDSFDIAPPQYEQ